MMPPPSYEQTGPREADAFYEKPFVTVTGADVKTDLDRLACLDVEVGLLLSDTAGGNRYASHDWINETANSLPHVSLHICGMESRFRLFRGDFDHILDRVQRVQINGRPLSLEINELHARRPELKIITQYSTAHRGYFVSQDLLTSRAQAAHAYVMDESGGFGKLPKVWSRPATLAAVGFAGGLSPDNLEEQLPLILQVAKGRWWINMETGVRTDDWFDLDKVQRVTELFAQIIERKNDGQDQDRIA